jgi:hypothetical protein
VLLGLIGLHILAALFHRFVLRDEVLQSMLPWRHATTAADAPKSTFAAAAAARQQMLALSVFTICPMRQTATTRHTCGCD